MYKNHIPTKLFEYFLAGLPVIASAFPIYEQIIDKYRCGICVDPTDPVAIVRAIEYLFNHPEERRRMAENARRAGNDYNWSTESSKLLSVYLDILESH